MKLPPGYEEVLADLGADFKGILDGLDYGTICELKKTIYGLVQAALMRYKKISDILVKKLILQKNCKDPCLFYKNDENGETIICLYVDDSAMMGEDKALDQTEIDLKTYFTMTIVEMMNYVGCNYIVTSKGLHLHQLKLITRIEENLVQRSKNYQ